jgi:hypothetical protein
VLTGTATGVAATFTGTVQQATSTTTGNASVGGNLAVTGSDTVTGASQAASYTAAGNGAVTGVLVPKSYTNEAAATSALPSPAVGTQVWLTAPTSTGQSAGLFYWNGTAWWPVNFAPPVFVGTQTVAQSIPANAFTSLTMDSEVVDTFNGHSTSTNTSRYTCALAGWYNVVGRYPTSGTANTKRIASIAVNGTGVRNNEIDPSDASLSTVEVTALVFLNVSDYVEVQVLQNTAGALNTNVASGYASTMEVHWLHA